MFIDNLKSFIASLIPEDPAIINSMSKVDQSLITLDKCNRVLFRDLNKLYSIIDKRLSALEKELDKWTNVNIQIWKKDSSAFSLEKNKEWDACYDVRAIDDVVIPSKERAMIDTGLVIAVPPHCEVQVRPRSGISANVAKPRKRETADGKKIDEEFPKNLTVHLGTCDAGYRDSYKIIVENGNDFPVIIKRGDKLAQIAIRTKPNTTEEYVVSREQLPEDDGRGTTGFGHSGV